MKEYLQKYYHKHCIFLGTEEKSQASADNNKGNLGQYIWDIRCETYGIPRSLEKLLQERRVLIFWAALFLTVFSLFPGLFPQIRYLLVLADISIKEEAIRAFCLIAGSFAFTWLLDRGWETEED